MSAAEQTDVLIVGAGLAGLAAAVALSGAGKSVHLLERKPYVGGRAYSYSHPALGEVIDSQHVLLGCCTNLIDLCRMAGADRQIRWYDNVTFLEPGADGLPALRSDIGPGWLPAPAHSSMSFLRAHMLSLADKSRIALGLIEFARGYPSADDEAFSTWLRRTRQTERAIRHFWEPVIVGALNDSFERCSTKYAAQVFYESFLKSAEGGSLGIPTLPMSEFYLPVAQLVERQGTALALRSSVDRIEQLPNGCWRALTSDYEEHIASNLLLALPFEQAQRLLQTLPEGPSGVADLLSRAKHFSHSPITTVHLWFDRDVTELDHAALLDTRIQWMFNKSRIRSDESVLASEGCYLELVISASAAEVQEDRGTIVSSAIEELGMFFPAARRAKLLKSGILKEARATFSVTPGLDRFRPVARAGVDGLYLAGDWTQTGWPSTMEGAVRSGRIAAEAVVGASSGRFLVPELPASWIMRALERTSNA